jgi:hypothetical protein
MSSPAWSSNNCAHGPWSGSRVSCAAIQTLLSTSNVTSCEFLAPHSERRVLGAPRGCRIDCHRPTPTRQTLLGPPARPTRRRPVGGARRPDRSPVPQVSCRVPPRPRPTAAPRPAAAAANRRAASSGKVITNDIGISVEPSLPIRTHARTRLLGGARLPLQGCRWQRARGPDAGHGWSRRSSFQVRKRVWTVPLGPAP